MSFANGLCMSWSIFRTLPLQMSSSIADDLADFRDRFGLPGNLSFDDLFKIACYYIKTG